MEVDPEGGTRQGHQQHESDTAERAAPPEGKAALPPPASQQQHAPPTAEPQHPSTGGGPQEPEPDPQALSVCGDLVQQLVAGTRGWLLGQMEVLHAQVGRGWGFMYCQVCVWYLHNHSVAPSPRTQQSVKVQHVCLNSATLCMRC
jgi:hypothetical protein